MSDSESVTEVEPLNALPVRKRSWASLAIGVAVLLASLLSLVDAVFSLVGSAWYFRTLGYTRDQVGYFTDLGWPMVVLWAVAVFAGVAGGLFLVLQQRPAAQVLAISAAAQLLLVLLSLTALNGWGVLGAGWGVRSIVLLLITAAAAGYAWWLGRSGFGAAPRRAE